MTQILFFVLAFVLALAPQASWATVGAVSSSMAGPGRASVEVTDAAILNPALVAFMRGYLFTSSYSAMNDKTGRDGNQFTLGLTDNVKDTIVPASLVYQQEATKGELFDHTNRDIRLAFGNKVTDHWAFGLGAHYREDRAVNEMQILPEGVPDRVTQTNLVIGNVFPLKQNIGFALVFENLLPARKDIPEEWRLLPQTALGFNYEFKRVFQARADIISASNNSFSKPTYGIGLQSFPNRWVAIRVGTQKNTDLDADIYSTGLGFLGPNFSLHYAYSHSPQVDRLTRHAIDLAVPLW